MVKLIRFALVVFVLLLVVIMVTEAASAGNPAALVFVAVVAGVFSGVIVALLLIGGIRRNHYHVHLHPAPREDRRTQVTVSSGETRLLEQPKTR